jgi:hypothetical protein
MLGSTLQGIYSGGSQRRKGIGRKYSLFGARLNMKSFTLTEPLPNPFVAINEFQFNCEAVVREHEPFFSAGTVLVDLERVDANLGFEEGGGNRTTGEREELVAGTVGGRGVGGW